MSKGQVLLVWASGDSFEKRHRYRYQDTVDALWHRLGVAVKASGLHACKFGLGREKGQQHEAFKLSVVCEDADAAFELVEPLLRDEQVVADGSVVKRYGTRSSSPFVRLRRVGDAWEEVESKGKKPRPSGESPLDQARKLAGARSSMDRLQGYKRLLELGASDEATAAVTTDRSASNVEFVIRHPTRSCGSPTTRPPTTAATAAPSRCRSTTADRARCSSTTPAPATTQARVCAWTTMWCCPPRLRTGPPAAHAHPHPHAG